MRRLRHVALCGLLLAAIALVYAEVGSHAYLNLDDDVYVLRNPWIRDGLRWETVRWAFTRVYEAYWIPLTWISLALDCRLFGVHAGAQLLENVAWHAVDSVLLYAILVAATGAIGRSAWVAAVFALHPMHDGITKMSFGGRPAGKGKASAQGKNDVAKGLTHLPTGVAAALTGNTSPTIELVTSNGLCVGAKMNTVKKDDGHQYKAQKK